MSFRHQKSPDELREALERQIRHLRRSNAAYDGGEVEEAERIAAALYLIFAHNKSNKALSRLTGVKGKLLFPDSRTYTERTKEPWIGPPLCRIGPKLTYEPVGPAPEGQEYPLVPYSKWWSAIVYRTDRGLELSRMNLIIALGNQDGGRHVDKFIDDEAYHWLKSRGDIHIRQGGDDLIIYINPKWPLKGQVSFRAWLEGGNARIGISDQWPPPPNAHPLRNAHWATVRQIGWEADRALTAAGF